LTPEMSTTEYIIVTSTAPTYGRVSPDATCRDHQLRHARPVARASPASRSTSARASEREDPVEPAVPVGAAPRHARRPGPSPSPRRRGHPRPRLGDVRRQLFAADVRRDEGSFTPASTRSTSTPCSTRQVAEERVLGAFRCRAFRGRTTVATMHAPRAARHEEAPLKLCILRQRRRRRLGEDRPADHDELALGRSTLRHRGLLDQQDREALPRAS